MKLTATNNCSCLNYNSDIIEHNIGPYDNVPVFPVKFLVRNQCENIGKQIEWRAAMSNRTEHVFKFPQIAKNIPVGSERPPSRLRVTHLRLKNNAN